MGAAIPLSPQLLQIPLLLVEYASHDNNQDYNHDHDHGKDDDNNHSGQASFRETVRLCKGQGTKPMLGQPGDISVVQKLLKLVSWRDNVMT